jgi:hypothetical protein
MPEHPSDHRRLLDERNEPESSTAPRTRQDVEPKGALHQDGPRPIASARWPCGLASGRVRFNRRDERRLVDPWFGCHALVV